MEGGKGKKKRWADIGKEKALSLAHPREKIKKGGGKKKEVNEKASASSGAMPASSILAEQAKKRGRWWGRGLENLGKRWVQFRGITKDVTVSRKTKRGWSKRKKDCKSEITRPCGLGEDGKRGQVMGSWRGGKRSEVLLSPNHYQQGSGGRGFHLGRSKKVGFPNQPQHLHA